ncbi:MAG: hypothetical protein WKF57_14255 [Nakamurella sp.]
MFGAAGFDMVFEVVGFTELGRDVLEGCAVVEAAELVLGVADALEVSLVTSFVVSTEGESLVVGPTGAEPASPSITPALAEVGESGGVALLQDPRIRSSAPSAASTPLSHSRIFMRCLRWVGAVRAFIGESPLVEAGPAACCAGTGRREEGEVRSAHRATPGGSVETDPPGEVRHGVFGSSEPVTPHFKIYR